MKPGTQVRIIVLRGYTEEAGRHLTSQQKKDATQYLLNSCRISGINLKEPVIIITELGGGDLVVAQGKNRLEIPFDCVSV